MNKEDDLFMSGYRCGFDAGMNKGYSEAATKYKKIWEEFLHKEILPALDRWENSERKDEVEE